MLSSSSSPASKAPSPVSILRGHTSGISSLLFERLSDYGGLTYSQNNAPERVDNTHKAENEDDEQDLNESEEVALSDCDPKYNNRCSSNRSTSDPRIISGSLSGELRIWDISSRQAIVNIQAHGDSILSLQLTNQGNLITSSRDGLLKVWDVSQMSNASSSTSTSSNSYKVSSHGNGCKASYSTGALGFAKASYDACSGLIASASSNEYEVLIWDLRQAVPVQSVNLQSSKEFTSGKGGDEKGFGMVTQIAFDRNGTQGSTGLTAVKPNNILIGYENGSLAAIDSRMFQPIATASLHENSITAIHSTRLKMSSEKTEGALLDDVIVSGAADASIHISRLDDPNTLKNSSKGGGYIDNDRVSSEASIKESTRSTLNIGIGHLSSIFGTKSSLDPSSNSSNNNSSTVPPNKKGSLNKLNSISIPKIGTADICVRPDYKLLVTSHWDKTIRVFQFKKNMKPLAIINFHRENVSALAYCGRCSDLTSLSQDCSYNNYFASGSNDCTIAIWDLYSKNSSAV